MSKNLDWWITSAYLLLSGISLATIASVAPTRLLSQAVWLLTGFLVYLYLSKQDSAVYSAISRISYPLAIILLMLTFVLGEDVRGSLRWIEIAGFHLQTSELAKPFLILAFSRIVSSLDLSRLKNLAIVVAYLALPVFLILKQPDLGTTLVVIAIITIQIFLTRSPAWIFLAGGALVALFAKYSENFLHAYQLKRLQSFIDPFSDPLGSGYNVIQSIIAIGSGGFLGKGLGHGTQSRLRFLPERHTDFIFASLVEELGFIGGVVVIISTGLLLYRLITLILDSHSAQNRLILAGIFGYIFFQSVVNVGMNLGIAPVTGVTLPLVSYGGSSVLAIAISLGIAASISGSKQSSDKLIEIK